MSPANDDNLLIEVPQGYRSSLAKWLNREQALHGRVHPVRPAPESGKMGAAIELLTVALGSGGTGAVLIRSINKWLSQRHLEQEEVSVTVKDASGHEFQFSAKSAKLDTAELFRKASAQFVALRDDSPGQEQAG